MKLQLQNSPGLYFKPSSPFSNSHGCCPCLQCSIDSRKHWWLATSMVSRLLLGQSYLPLVPLVFYLERLRFKIAFAYQCCCSSLERCHTQTTAQRMTMMIFHSLQQPFCCGCSSCPRGFERAWKTVRSGSQIRPGHAWNWHLGSSFSAALLAYSSSLATPPFHWRFIAVFLWLTCFVILTVMTARQFQALFCVIFEVMTMALLAIVRKCHHIASLPFGLCLSCWHSIMSAEVFALAEGPVSPSTSLQSSWIVACSHFSLLFNS